MRSETAASRILHALDGHPPEWDKPFFDTERKGLGNWLPDIVGDSVVSGAGVKVIEKVQGRAFFSLEKDEITLPTPRQFKSQVAYYGTLFHELIHASGHPSRMNRATLIVGMSDGFGSRAYAREELVAEIGGMILLEEAGFEPPIDRHASYIKAWLEAFTGGDSRLSLIRRSSQVAADAAAYLMAGCP